MSKTFSMVWRIFFLLVILIGAGCQPDSQVPKPAIETNGQTDELSIYRAFEPDKVGIISLTEFVVDQTGPPPSKIRAYVVLLDDFGNKRIAPAVFRFELYEKLVRTAQPKGNRLAIWPDIDLTELKANNNYWRDFLRAYEFDLEFEPQANKTYILQINCRTLSGKRISVEFDLKYIPK